jgi:hypothetical protein
MKPLVRIFVNPFTWTVEVHYGEGVLTEELHRKKRTMAAAQLQGELIAERLGLTPTQWCDGLKPTRCRRRFRFLECHTQQRVSE